MAAVLSTFNPSRYKRHFEFELIKAGIVTALQSVPRLGHDFVIYINKIDFLIFGFKDVS